MKKLDIVGLCGSFRSDSINRMALKLAGELMPEGMSLEILDYSDFPFFNGDLLAKGLPATVLNLRQRIRKADAVVIATPEYNFSVPGVLKNALDWLSRGDDQPFQLKPTAILSASPGPIGGARVQYDLRKIMLFMNTPVLAKPEVFIGNAGAKFAPDGQCTDELTRKFVAEQMRALQSWIAAVQRMNG